MSMCFALEGDNFLDCTASQQVCSILLLVAFLHRDQSTVEMSFLGFSKQLLFIFPLFLRSFCQNALINKAQMEILIDDFNLTSHS